MIVQRVFEAARVWEVLLVVKRGGKQIGLCLGAIQCSDVRSTVEKVVESIERALDLRLWLQLSLMRGV